MAARSTSKRSPGRPRSLPIEEQRAVVMAAARTVFAAHDYHGASIEAVAREAGVARSLVYELFGSKSDLFIAVVDDAVEQMIARFATTDDDPSEVSLHRRIRGPVEAWFDFIRDEPDVAAMVRIAEYGGIGPAKSGVAAGRQRIEDGLAAVYRLAWEPYADIGDDLAHLLALMTLVLVEAVGFRQTVEAGWDRDRTIDQVTDFIVGGFVGVYRDMPRRS